MSGRPSQKVEISLTNPLRSLIHFRRFCENNEEGCSNIKTFAESLLNLTRTSSSQSTQTDSDESFLMQNVCKLSENGPLVNNISPYRYSANTYITQNIHITSWAEQSHTRDFL